MRPLRVFLGGEVVHGVVAAFHIHIGHYCSQETRGEEFVKNKHAIHRFQRGQNGGAILLDEVRSIGSLELTRGTVTVHAHEQCIGLVSG